MRLHHKSQSALEYLMTYGWAILIIVIVAVILYSMGIFNPGAGVTASSSGFSPFAISSVICSQAGLKIAIIAGGLPNNAVSATISKIYFQSNTGTIANLNQGYNIGSITLSSGQSTTFIVPGVACASSGISFSLSSRLQYTYSTPAGSVVTNASGTIAGISSSPTITAYVPLTISSSASTPNPFQQMVKVNMNNYATYASSNLDNIEFTYPNGTIIPSWRENGTANNQIVVYWLKLGSFTSITVHMDFLSSSVLDNVNTGEAPTLSTTYGEYDNGANVFTNYWNFAGTTLPSGFTNYNDGGTSTVDNGLNININEGQAVCTAPNHYSLVYDTPINAANTIVETYDSGTRAAGPVDLGIYTANSDTAGGYAGVADTYGWGYGSISGGYTNLGDPFDISSGTGVASIYWVGQGNEGVGWNYNFVSSTDTSETYSSSLYLAIGMGSCTGGSDITYYWLRTRAYPPNGVMPSGAFESLV